MKDNQAIRYINDDEILFKIHFYIAQYLLLFFMACFRASKSTVTRPRCSQKKNWNSQKKIEKLKKKKKNQKKKKKKKNLVTRGRWFFSGNMKDEMKLILVKFMKKKLFIFDRLCFVSSNVRSYALESTRPKTNSAQTKSAQNQLGPKPTRPCPGLRDPSPLFFSFLLSSSSFFFFFFHRLYYALGIYFP